MNRILRSCSHYVAQTVADVENFKLILIHVEDEIFDVLCVDLVLSEYISAVSTTCRVAKTEVVRHGQMGCRRHLNVTLVLYRR